MCLWRKWGKPSVLLKLTLEFLPPPAYLHTVGEDFMKRIWPMGWVCLAACGQGPSSSFTDEVQSALGILRVDTQDVVVDEDPWDNDWKPVSLDLIEGRQSQRYGMGVSRIGRVMVRSMCGNSFENT